ncbi:transcriptional regulator [Streptomyces lydicus]|uniref:Transcriptional regulator n=1 Tax=Streptomyces lydicus TaxID=47763 RepID=A0A3Q9K3B1_9ACTN|nr:helix-turn-helix transcriptional regulator [Streptomyces lydicus]AZS70849.1 transcriptional regulator [Streptomyces lydicus]
MSTPPSSSAVKEARVSFGRRLRDIRKDSGLTARALAALAGWHESKCSKIESGTRPPSLDDIRAYAEHCGVLHLANDLIDTARGIDGMYVEWRQLERSGLRRVQESVLPLWERTLRYRIYSSWLIPGPVQTEAYIRALLTSIRDRRQLVDDVEEAVRVRVDKQHILHNGNHRFSIILEEAALRYRIGGVKTMAGQLGHLLKVSRVPSVSLGIIPLTADRSALCPVEGFFLFDDAQANVELVSAHLTIVQRHEIGLYASTFATLAEQAEYGTGARALITQAIDALG